MRGKIGINAAFYIGHCALRRYVMGDAAQEREATPEEIERMAALVTEAMEAGAAGLQLHPLAHPLRLRRPAGAVAAVEPRRAQGAHRGGRSRRRRLASPTCRAPRSAASRPRTRQLLIEMSLLSRMPVIIQGLGARSKVDAPTAGWDNAKRFVDEATAQGAAVYSMAMSKPFNRTFNLADGTKLYEGALAAQPPLHRGVDGGRSGWRSSPTRRSATRCATPSTTRTAIPTPVPRCRRPAGRCCTSTR